MLFEAPSDENSFVNNFQTAREESIYANEEKQAQLLLRLLEEMDLPKRNKHSKELLRIAENGDIIRDDNLEKLEKKRVMGVDDLPKESLDEMLFGKQKEEEPVLKIQNGRRLKDGKQIQRVNFDEFELTLGSIRFETVLLVGLFLLFAFFFLRRLFKHPENNNLDRVIEKKVNERLNALLFSKLVSD